MSVSEESRGVSDGGRTRGNYSTFTSNDGVNTVDTNRGKLRCERQFSSFEEYRISGSFDVTRVLFANRCTLIDGYSTFERSRRK